jgi:hypothetical protein
LSGSFSQVGGSIYGLGASASYTDTGLNSNTSYYYKVQVLRYFGDTLSDFSSVVSATTQSGGGGGKVTEANITVTGLSSKTGKYLGANVFPLGQTQGSMLLTSAEHIAISSNSVTIHLIQANGASIDPNGTYNVGLYIYYNASDTGSGDWSDITNVKFTSGSATVSY